MLPPSVVQCGSSVPIVKRRISVKAHLALRLAAIANFILLAAAFPSALVDATPQWDIRNMAVASVLWLALASLPLLTGLGLFGTVAGCLAILAHRRWGVWVHLFSTGLCGLDSATIERQYTPSALSDTLQGLMMITCGFIYGLAFFTDALTPLNKKVNRLSEGKNHDV